MPAIGANTTTGSPAAKSLASTCSAGGQSSCEVVPNLVQRNPLLKYNPHPKQHEYHCADTRLKGFFGGNQSGKTTAGLVDDIITALVRYKSLFVIARNSSLSYKGQALDLVEIGRDLGVRYALTGSVRKSGERLRICGQLIDASSGSHLWADTFDGNVGEIFDLQDEVSSRVAGVIDPVLSEAEIRRASERPTFDLTAYDLYLHAVPLVNAWSNEAATAAIGLLEQAVARVGAKLDYTNIAYGLLPDLFTIRELQVTYEAILRRPLDRRNFRKRMLSAGIIEATDEVRRRGADHRKPSGAGLRHRLNALP